MLGVESEKKVRRKINTITGMRKYQWYEQSYQARKKIRSPMDLGKKWSKITRERAWGKRYTERPVKQVSCGLIPKK